MSGGLFDYIQKQQAKKITDPLETSESLSEPRAQIYTGRTEKRSGACRAVYKAYQENILKGIQQGENTAILLLKALKVISCMTGEDLTYQIATLMTVYGEVLRQPDSLEVTRAEVQKRLVCLETALQGADGTERERILQAIKAHREKLEQLKHSFWMHNLLVRFYSIFLAAYYVDKLYKM